MNRTLFQTTDWFPSLQTHAAPDSEGIAERIRYFRYEPCQSETVLSKYESLLNAQGPSLN